jgi:hypothetical protein
MQPREWPTDANFVKIELQTGITFADIALSAKYPDKVQRNRANARKAYDTALEYIDRVPLDGEMANQLRELLEHLRDQLAQLGESV